MRRTTASGHDTNRYTEGNPSLGVPATVVSAEAANAWQEEIVNVILSAGLTPAVSETQLLESVLAIASHGGAQITAFAIANNVGVAASVTGLLFSALSFKSAKIFYGIDRRTTSSNVQQTGTLTLIYDATDAIWRISDQSDFDDAGVVFTINGSGQINYTSTNISGTSYVGTLHATITKLKLA